jgi:hypothetical protein
MIRHRAQPNLMICNVVIPLHVCPRQMDIYISYVATRVYHLMICNTIGMIRSIMPPTHTDTYTRLIHIKSVKLMI